MLTSILVNIAMMVLSAGILYELLEWLPTIFMYLSTTILDLSGTYFNDIFTFRFFEKIEEILDIPSSWSLTDIIYDIAVALIMILLIVNVLRSMLSQATGEKISSPIIFVLRAIAVGLLLHILFKLDFRLIAEGEKANIALAPKGLVEVIAYWFGGIFEKISNNASLATTLASLSATTDTAFTDWQTRVIALFISATLMTAVLQAALTLFERVVSFGIYVLLGPIFIAFFTSEDTADTAKQWIIGLFTQLFAILLSLVLWYLAINTFIKAIGLNQESIAKMVEDLKAIGIDLSSKSIRDIQSELQNLTVEQAASGLSSKEILGYDAAEARKIIGEIKPLETTEEIMHILVTITLFSLCRNSEKIFNAVGLKTMPSGDTARSFLAGMGTAAGSMMLAGRFLTRNMQQTGRAISGGINDAVKQNDIANKNSVLGVANAQISEARSAVNGKDIEINKLAQMQHDEQALARDYKNNANDLNNGALKDVNASLDQKTKDRNKIARGFGKTAQSYNGVPALAETADGEKTGTIVGTHKDKLVALTNGALPKGSKITGSHINPQTGQQENFTMGTVVGGYEGKNGEFINTINPENSEIAQDFYDNALEDNNLDTRNVNLADLDSISESPSQIAQYDSDIADLTQSKSELEGKRDEYLSLADEHTGNAQNYSRDIDEKKIEREIAQDDLNYWQAVQKDISLTDAKEFSGRGSSEEKFKEFINGDKTNIKQSAATHKYNQASSKDNKSVLGE